MTTREVIARMPKKILCHIENLKKDYHNSALRKDEVRHEIAGYVKGLRDAGFISERERQVLYAYATI